VGGLEKDRVTGNVSYVPDNHEYMTKIRSEKVKRVANYIPDIEPEFAKKGDLLVIGWGGTYGSLHSAVKEMNDEGYDNVGLAHFNYINPLPKNTEELIKGYKKVIVCELNNGQFANVLRMNFSGIEFLQHNKIQGLPFGNTELIEKFKQFV
jgi:2-oxoglutarate ferredoxin oxidoreductase subunit alpha